MPSTKRQFNWTGVGFTPASGSAVTITGVTQVDFDAGGSLAKFSGDGDRYNTTVINDFNEPIASVTAADTAALINCGPIGTVGTFAATHNDAKNLAATGGGALSYSLANAVIETRKTGGSHRQFGSGSMSFCSYSTDGVTSPLSMTIL